MDDEAISNLLIYIERDCFASLAMMVIGVFRHAHVFTVGGGYPERSRDAYPEGDLRTHTNTSFGFARDRWALRKLRSGYSKFKTSSGNMAKRGKESPELYHNPQYYEIAFSFRDIPTEVDVFEECIKRLSHIPVKTVLELGCGNSPHMEELIKRGYRYNGLDLSKTMLEYSREKAINIGAEVNLIHADMNDFSLEAMFDFVYVMLGSLSVKSTSELINHFNSVAKVLKKGCLYLLDWCIHLDPPWALESGGSWEMEHEGINVKTTVSWKVINRVDQTYEEKIVQEVNDHGKKLSIVDKDIKRAIFPQEFLCFISTLKHLEFVGWWNNWDLDQPLEQAEKIDRPIALLRRV